jgi:hypothetical protein
MELHIMQTRYLLLPLQCNATALKI